MRNKICALLIKPRMWLALVLLRFIPVNHSIMKGTNKLGERRWFVFTESEEKLLCVTWDQYADHWKAVLRASVSKDKGKK